MASTLPQFSGIAEPKSAQVPKASKPPKAAEANDGPPASRLELLSTRDQEFLLNAWLCLKELPEIDFVRLAPRLGYTNPRSGSNAWLSIKKKLFSDPETAILDQGSSPAFASASSPAPSRTPPPAKGPKPNPRVDRDTVSKPNAKNEKGFLFKFSGTQMTDTSNTIAESHTLAQETRPQNNIAFGPSSPVQQPKLVGEIADDEHEVFAGVTGTGGELSNEQATNKTVAPAPVTPTSNTSRAGPALFSNGFNAGRMTGTTATKTRELNRLTPADSGSKKYPEPSASEVALFVNIAKFDRNPPDVDWDAVAIASSYKNAETAKVRFRQIKVKLGLIDAPGAPASSARTGPFPEPSQIEATLFVNITRFSRQKPNVNWDAVAAASGFKNAESAKVRFRQIKLKLGLVEPQTHSRKRKAEGAENNPNNGMAAAAGPPAKRAMMTPAPDRPLRPANMVAQDHSQNDIIQQLHLTQMMNDRGCRYDDVDGSSKGGSDVHNHQSYSDTNAGGWSQNQQTLCGNMASSWTASRSQLAGSPSSIGYSLDLNHSAPSGGSNWGPTNQQSSKTYMRSEYEPEAGEV